MHHSSRPKVAYDVQKMAEDMAERGWLNTDLARVADVSDMTVTRFFSGQHRTSTTAKKLAEALGYSIRRYIVRSEEAVSA